MSHCSSTDSAGTIETEGLGDDAVAHRSDGFRDVVGFEQLVALLVDHLALVVGDVVVFEQLLADVEVAGFHLALRRFQRAGDERMLDRFAFRHFQLVHDGAQTLTSKDAQQGIVERQVEARGTGIALTTGATAQLVVDAARFVAFGTDDVQTAGSEHLIVRLLPFGTHFGDFRVAFGRRQRFVVLDRRSRLFDTATEHDVGTTTGHVGGDGDHTRSTGFNDDFCFAGMLLGVEHVVHQAFLVRAGRKAVPRLRSRSCRPALAGRAWRIP